MLQKKAQRIVGPWVILINMALLKISLDTPLTYRGTLSLGGQLLFPVEVVNMQNVTDLWHSRPWPVVFLFFSASWIWIWLL